MGGANGELVLNLYLLVSHAITNACIELVERLPRELGIRKVLGCLNGPLQCRRPNLS